MNIEAYFKVTYGLYVIATKADNQLGGYIANTAFQVTATPAQFAISCNKDNFTSELIQKSGIFSISVLEQEADPKVIGTFGYSSGRDIDKFENINYFYKASGAPIVTDSCVAWFDCKLVQSFEVGTHIIFVGEVLDYDLIDESKNPLTYAYYREVKKGFSPKNAPTYIDKEKLPVQPEPEPVQVSTPGTEQLASYTCQICHYIYNPENGDPISGIPPGTPFEDLPDEWICPLCGASKDMFHKN